MRLSAEQIIIECLKSDGVRYWFGIMGERIIQDETDLVATNCRRHPNIVGALKRDSITTERARRDQVLQ